MGRWGDGAFFVSFLLPLVCRVGISLLVVGSSIKPITAEPLVTHSLTPELRSAALTPPHPLSYPIVG